MWRILILLFPTAALGDSLVAARVIKAQTPLVAADVMLVAADIPGALTDPAQAIGQETRVAIYPGRPVLGDSLGPAAMVERNQIVPLIFQAGGLAIRTEGRALSRGAEGEIIEVMNLASRTKVTGRVGADGGVTVGPATPP